MLNAKELRERRKKRSRYAIRKVEKTKPRLSVFRSNKQIYAQVIDDLSGRTVANASSLDKDLRGTLNTGGNSDAATAVGKLIAERAKASGVTTVVFDRGGYRYHDRVKALADAAREAGLQL